MFKSAGCHQTGKVLENALRQNVSTQSPQVLFDRMNYTDHLGNIRLSYTKEILPGNGSNLKILEEIEFTRFANTPEITNYSEQNNYYPFGLKHGRYNTPARDIRPLGEGREVLMVNHNPYQYQYNGKEWQEELGLNVTSMDFRQYDNALGRFMNPDALSELYYAYSPYNFVGNMPMYFSDPTGLEWYQHKESGAYKYFPGKGEVDGWSHVGTSVSFYDENYGGFITGNTIFDADGNERGGILDFLNSDGDISKSVFLFPKEEGKISFFEKLMNIISPPENRGVWWSGGGYSNDGGSPNRFYDANKTTFRELNIRIGSDAFGFAAFETLRSLGILRKTTISQPEVRDTVILDSIFVPAESGIYLRTGKTYSYPNRWRDTLIRTKTNEVELVREKLRQSNSKNSK